LLTTDLVFIRLLSIWIVRFVCLGLLTLAIGDRVNPLEFQDIKPVRNLHALTPTPIRFSPEEQATIDIFEKVSKSVVFITNTSIRRDFWSFNTFEVPQGGGSGFV